MIKNHMEHLKALREVSMYFHAVEENGNSLSEEQEMFWVELTQYLESQG